MQTYTAVIMDIRASKKMEPEERQRCQEKLGRVLGVVNDVYGPHMESKAEFSAGDSIQALFLEPADALGFCFCVQKLMYPFKLYAGIGIGELTVRVENAGSNAQDGPCYHYARKALEQCNVQAIEVCGDGGKELEFVNSMLYVLTALEANLSPKQRDIRNLLELTLPFIMDEYESQRYWSSLQSFIQENVVRYKIAEISALEHIYESAKLLQQNAISIGTDWIKAVSLLLGTTYENIRQIVNAGQLATIQIQKWLCCSYAQSNMKRG